MKPAKNKRHSKLTALANQLGRQEEDPENTRITTPSFIPVSVLIQLVKFSLDQKGERVVLLIRTAVSRSAYNFCFQ
jgi:hypothetical protein